MNAAFSSISFLLSVSLQEEISYMTTPSLSSSCSSYFYFLFSLSSPSLTPLSWLGYIRNLALTTKR